MLDFRSDKVKGILSILMVLIAFVFSSNTNNNPIPFIDRIIKPSTTKNGTIYFGWIIIILLISIGLKGINRNLLKNKFSSKFTNILIVIIVLLLPAITINGAKIYKTFTNGLDSIYCYRNDKNLELLTIDDEKIEANIRLRLKNFSDEPQKFYIKIIAFEIISENINKIEFYVVNDDNTKKEFILYGKEEKTINEVFEITVNKENEPINSIHSNTSYFEFELFNENENVKFIERFSIFQEEL